MTLITVANRVPQVTWMSHIWLSPSFYTPNLIINQCLFPSHFSAHCLIHYTTLISFLSHRNSPPHSTEAPTPLLPLPQYCNHQFCPSLYTWTSYSRWDSPLYRSMQLILPQTALKTDTNLLHNTVTPTRCLIPQNEKFLNQSDVELCALPSNKINTGL